MLLRLELVGFKSFADKTIFEFAPGITAIVGPNGSGKSNVVDAIRWLLGEQSIRSLRGGEMADVIFQGSARRKSLGMAEVSVLLDNRRRLLAVDADQVQLTRRLYRDGSGEYLINQQPARLRDFKDIFLGSGTGSSGYTIIAQGRVEELLQASPLQRRELLDEAAGISRFKARKQETLRKLSQVEEHLSRSQDRLQHLEAQLRTCRLQAAKAQKYQEHQQRLHDLRRRWYSFEERRLAQAVAELEQAFHQADQTAAQLHQQFQQSLATEQTGEQQLEHAVQQQHLLITEVAEIRRRLATEETTLQYHLQQWQALVEEKRQLSHQRLLAVHCCFQLEQDRRQLTEQANATENRVQTARAEVQQLETALQMVRDRLQGAESRLSRLRDEQFEAVRVAAAARTAAHAALAQLQRLQHELQRRHTDTVQTAARRQTLQATLESLIHADQNAQSELNKIVQIYNELNVNKKQLEDKISSLQVELEQMRIQHGDLRGRLELLEEWDRSQVGIEAAVRGLLEERQQQAVIGKPHPLVDQVLGLVADLLLVPRDLAPLVDMALGEKAQYLVVADAAAVPEILRCLPSHLPGRIGLIPLQGRPLVPTPQEEAPFSSLASHVRSSVDNLAQQLLGDILIIDDWDQACATRRRFPAYRLVTRSGILWETDGTIIVGSVRATGGLVSRKSELREVREQLRLLVEQIRRQEQHLGELEQSLERLTAEVVAAEQRRIEWEKRAAEARQQLDKHRQIIEQLDERWNLINQETHYLEEELLRTEKAWLEANQQADHAEQAAERIHRQIAQQEQLLRDGEAELERLRERHQAAQVALSQALSESEQFRDRLTRVDEEVRRCQDQAHTVQIAVQTVQQRHDELLLGILQLESQVAELYTEKDRLELQVDALQRQQEAHRLEAAQRRSHLQRLQQQLEQAQKQRHHLELRLRELQGQRFHLHQKVKEELNVEPQELLNDHSLESESRADANEDVLHLLQEIEEVKSRIARLGAVNLEALEQLQGLEKEYQQYLNQHQDLEQARRSLVEIMEQLNGDSRKLFMETLTAVRGHFQELFRKLFGGGQADIVVENEAEVLESGIEIVARPPGKELRSLTLLSGGEKTLTAIALLLAMFRARPSPFCILDEVDAALDETNTVRLASLLREFLDTSQFIIVTHKKRMMAVADRLWGVTMTEQGVSRILPLRFEDWESAQAA
ncbi:MAG: chromosome segregation protein SMC [Gemmataceae bacterium]|nr:chromosome segregation protein SMC [Gemmataceae bacterium]